MSMWNVMGAVAAAFGLGAMLGATRLRRVYDWRSVWEIPAPRDVVYGALTSPGQDEHWWPSMVVDAYSSGPLAVGSTVDFTVLQAPSVRRLAPPFRLHCVYTAVDPGRRLRQLVTGGLNGALEVHLEDAAPGQTRVIWDWYVSVGNPMLNLLGYAIEPVFRHSHDSVMDEGEDGLRSYCIRQIAKRTAARDG